MFEAGLANSIWEGAWYNPAPPGTYYGATALDRFHVYYTTVPVADAPYGAPGRFDVWPWTAWRWLRNQYGHWA